MGSVGDWYEGQVSLGSVLVHNDLYEQMAMGPCGGPHDHEKRVLAMVHNNHPAVYVQVVGIDL